MHLPNRTPILGAVAMNQPATPQTAGATLKEMHLTVTSTPLPSEHRSNHQRKTREKHDRSRIPVKHVTAAHDSILRLIDDGAESTRVVSLRALRTLWQEYDI